MEFLSSLDVTTVVMGIIGLCGTIVTGLLTFLGVTYAASLSRNKIAADTKATIEDGNLRKAQTDNEVQLGMIRLNDELERRMTEMKAEIKELREDQRGLREDKRILEERLMDVQKKYDAILKEYQLLMASHKLKQEENERLHVKVDEQRKILEELRARMTVQETTTSTTTTLSTPA